MGTHERVSHGHFSSNFLRDAHVSTEITHVAAALIWCQWAAQVRGAGSKSGTMEKALLEAHAARTLAEGSYQDARFSLPPGFLGGATGSRPHHLSGP